MHARVQAIGERSEMDGAHLGVAEPHASEELILCMHCMHACMHGLHLGVAEPVLGLPLELRLAHLDGDDRAEPLAQKVAGERRRLRGQREGCVPQAGRQGSEGLAVFHTFSLILPAARPCALSTRVSAALRPSTCVPPCGVCTPLANPSTDSEYL